METLPPDAPRRVPKRESDVDIVHVPFETVMDSNYVAVFDLGIVLSVSDLARKNELLFEPRTAAIARFVHPKTTTMVFCTGRVLVVGSRTEEHALLASWLLVRELKRLGYARATLNDFRISNITSTFKLQGAFDSLKYYRDFPTTSQIEIEWFPGITIGFPFLKIVLVAFNSGSLNVTGCVHPDETLAVLDAKMPVLQRYLCTDKESIREVFERSERARNSGKKETTAERRARKRKLAMISRALLAEGE